VWDSTPAGEYEECLTKTRVLSPRLRDFDLLETMLWSPLTGYSLLDYHLKRLAWSAEYFGYHADVQKIRKELSNIAAGLPPEPHRIRLLVSHSGAIRCESAPMESTSPCFGNVALAKSPIDARDIFLYHKTSRRSIYEDALKMCPGCDDVLLFNEAGHATESTKANIAVEMNGILYTPPIRCGLLPGTQRAWLLKHARLRERVLSVQEVLRSPNVYFLNSVRGMQKVTIRSAKERNMPNKRILH
jgi:para-aminobenzoate synthetase / 4-amino-4-deoxychorismate lyase